MALPDPISREDQYLSNIAGEETELPAYPITRAEQYLAKIAGESVETPDHPVSREEQYLAYIAEHGGGGGGTEVEPLTVTENGTYTAEEGTAYNPVTVNVSGGGGEPAKGVITTAWDEDGYSTAVKTIGMIDLEGYFFYPPTRLGDVIGFSSRINSIELNDGVETIGTACFQKVLIEKISIPRTVKSIDTYVFNMCNNLTEITFLGTPISITPTSLGGANSLTVVNVPWSLGEVADAPWGATNATINYNYVG